MKSIWAGLFCVLCAPAMAQGGCDAPAPPPFSEEVTSDQGPVVAARYVGATSAYPHGVLGDAVEARALLVQLEDGTCAVIGAGPDRVFEDTSPRLVDLDGDGLNEVIAVASSATQGARLEVYGYTAKGADFELLAATPYIGTRFRWLAFVGATDLDGDGLTEIAYVDRPHLAKTLRIWRYENRRLTEIATQQGYSNHKIGWPFIAGGIRRCNSGPEMILSTGNWSRLMAIQLKNGQLKARDLGPFTGPESLDAALNCG